MSQTLTETKNPSDGLAAINAIHTLKLRGDGSDVKYPQYLPVFPKTKFPSWEYVPYTEAGTRGTPDKRHLFADGGTRRELTPALGEEIEGVQLSSLTNEGRDDLALLAAERGVLIFRNQDFKDIGAQAQVDFISYYGRPHLHPTSGHPEGFPEFHVVYRDGKSITDPRYKSQDRPTKISQVSWHQDHTSEIQPPGLTVFFALETPPSGGDTLFVSLTEAYNRLSEPYKKSLEHLWVEHTNEEMLVSSEKGGGPARFTPSTVNHPLIQIHPATGEKILAIHNGFSKRIAGVHEEESANLRSFLNTVIAQGGDFQARAKWEPGTVVVWDNRVVAHTATNDIKGDGRRHVLRIAAMANKPIPAVDAQ